MHTRKFSWFVAMDREGCVLPYFTHTQRVACFRFSHTHTHTHTHGCVLSRFLYRHTHRAVCFSISHTYTYTHRGLCVSLFHTDTDTHHTHTHTHHTYTTHTYTLTHTHTHTTAGKDQTWPVLVNWQLIQVSRITIF